MEVEVYRNLRNGKYSVRSLQGRDKGRVVLHCDYVQLLGVDFKVSQAGRDRVLRERKKYVHATVRGTLGKFVGVQPKPNEHETVLQGDDIGSFNLSKWVPFTYNPFKFSSFVKSETEKPIDKAHAAILSTLSGTSCVEPQ